MKPMAQALHYLGQALDALQFAVSNDTPAARDHWIDAARLFIDAALIALGAIEEGAK